MTFRRASKMEPLFEAKIKSVNGKKNKIKSIKETNRKNMNNISILNNL